jgi:hypothetical protein
MLRQALEKSSQSFLNVFSSRQCFKCIKHICKTSVPTTCLALSCTERSSAPQRLLGVLPDRIQFYSLFWTRTIMPRYNALIITVLTRTRILSNFIAILKWTYFKVFTQERASNFISGSCNESQHPVFSQGFSQPWKAAM